MFSELIVRGWLKQIAASRLPSCAGKVFFRGQGALRGVGRGRFGRSIPLQLICGKGALMQMIPVYGAASRRFCNAAPMVLSIDNRR